MQVINRRGIEVFLRFLFIFSLGILFSLGVYAQEQPSIWLLDGKKIPYSKITKFDTTYIYYTSIHKGKDKRIARYKTYGFTNGLDTNIKVLYIHDTSIEGELDSKEMYYAVLGAQDARQYFKPKPTIISGLAIGVMSGFLIPVSPIISPIPLAAATIGVNLFNPPVKWQPEAIQEKMKNPAYQVGYQHYTNDLKVRKIAKYGFLSLVATAVPLIIFLK